MLITEGREMGDARTSGTIPIHDCNCPSAIFPRGPVSTRDEYIIWNIDMLKDVSATRRRARRVSNAEVKRFLLVTMKVCAIINNV